MHTKLFTRIMKAVMYGLVVLYLTLTNLCELRETFQIKDVSETSLTYDTNYFIKLSANNNFLRWDGNTNGDLSGLAYVTQTNLTNSTDESLIRSYIFVIERDVNSMIKIKNVVTNRYISYYSWSYGFVLSNSNDAYNNSLRLVNYGNSLTIVSANASTISSISYLSSSNDWSNSLLIYAVSTSTSIAAFQFIAAPNITQLPSPVIGDTNLKYGQNYFIKLSANNYYLRYDGNNNGDVSGLAYVFQSNLPFLTNESLIRSYIFVIERDVNSMVKIKNVLTNRYISYYTSSYGFVLANNNAYNNSLRPVIHASSNSLDLLPSDAVTISYFSSSHVWRLNTWVNTVSTSSLRSTLQFIAAPNISLSSPPVIGDTDLIYDTEYFIKLDYNINYLRWDGNTNGDVSGLIFEPQNDLTSITDEAEKESYLFVIEPDVNHMIKLRNTRTNRYLSSYELSLTDYILSDNSSHNNTFRLVLDPTTNLISIGDPNVLAYVNHNGNTLSYSLFVYYIQRSEYANYFQFISSTLPPPATTSPITPTTPSESTILTASLSKNTYLIILFICLFIKY